MIKEIYERRTYRKYTDEIISEDIIKEIVKSGFNSPSSMNSKPSEFIIVRDRKKLDLLGEMNQYSFMTKKSNLVIVVCGEETTEYWQQDMSAATENMLLTASSYNIGSCWIGVAPKNEQEEYVREVLNIPNNKRVLNLISFGYIDVKKENNNFYDVTKVHYDKY